MFHITDELRSKVLEIYNSQKFNTPKPFVLGPTEDVQELVKYYSDSIEEFLEEVEPNGKAAVTNISLVVLSSGDIIPRDCNLPGQYTAVHYITFDPSNHQADIYYHPAYDVLRCLGSNDLASGVLGPKKETLSSILLIYIHRLLNIMLQMRGLH